MTKQKTYTPQIYSDKELKNKSGIYQIRNLQDGKLYIGSTLDFKTRKNKHLNDLKQKIHVNSHLQNAYNLYGQESFVFEIIEFIKNKDKLLEYEQYWIDRFNVYNSKYGYNISKKAGRPPLLRGYKFNKEHNKKISVARMGMKFTAKHIKNMSLSRLGKYTGDKNTTSKAVICLETGKRYASINIAQKELKIYSIDRVCKNIGYTAGGLHWMFEKDYKKATPEEIQNKLSQKKYCQPKQRKSVICVETGIVYKSLGEAERETGINKTSIANVCSGIYKTAGKLHWKFTNTIDNI